MSDVQHVIETIGVAIELVAVAINAHRVLIDPSGLLRISAAIVVPLVSFLMALAYKSGAASAIEKYEVREDQLFNVSVQWMVLHGILAAIAGSGEES